MSNRNEIGILLLLITANFIAGTPRSQKAEWKGKIEIENGVKIVKNPGEPFYGQIKLNLKEELRIGRGNETNYAFNRARGIFVDIHGNIYVADMSNLRVQVFDKNGKFQRTIGIEGSGPSLFQQPVKVVIDDPTGNIYVRDRLTIKVFDREGKFILSVSLNKFPEDFVIGENGIIFAKLASVEESGELSKDFCEINLKGEILKTIATYPFQYMVKAKFSEGYGVIRTGHEHDLHIGSVANETILFGYSSEYEINATNGEGDLLFKIRKDESYQIIPANVIKQFKKPGIIFNPPPHKSFFYSILTDDKQRIYVQTNHTIDNPDANKELDVFSKEGFYLYKTNVPNGTYVIKNGFLYVRPSVEEGVVESVKRYKIKNWGQIKEGIQEGR